MARTIFATDDEIKMHKSLTELLQFEDLVVVGQEYHEINQTLMIVCVPRWPVAICPDCQGVCQKVHDYPHQRSIHDVPLRGCSTWLIFDSRRFECEVCQNVFTEAIRDVVPECTYTYRLMDQLADPRRKQAVATLAALYGLGYKLVESIMLKAASQKIEQRSQGPIQVKQLGIDEISQSKGQGEYVLVLTDLQKRVLLDILPDRHQQTLIAWLEKPPSGINLASLETVATDLWAHYRQAVQTVYSTVKVVADRFHVMQNLNEVIHQSRREAQTQAKSDQERSTLKGLRYVLLKDQAKLKETEKERLELLQPNQPQLYQLCKLRQQLHDWYETDTSPELAQLALQSWIKEAVTLGLSHLDKFCATLTHWQNEVVNFFANRVTSGFVEGMNSKIRLLKRIAFGLPNFNHFRLRMIWACG
jgi:transposase